MMDASKSESFLSTRIVGIVNWPTLKQTLTILKSGDLVLVCSSYCYHHSIQIQNSENK